MGASYCPTLPLHHTLVSQLNSREPGSLFPRGQWEWGGLASRLQASRVGSAGRAYSIIDRLLEVAMDDPRGLGKFKILLESPVSHLEPKPEAGKKRDVTSVVVKTSSREFKIKCKMSCLLPGPSKVQLS